MGARACTCILDFLARCFLPASEKAGPQLAFNHDPVQLISYDRQTRLDQRSVGDYLCEELSKTHPLFDTLAGSEQRALLDFNRNASANLLSTVSLEAMEVQHARPTLPALQRSSIWKGRIVKTYLPLVFAVAIVVAMSWPTPGLKALSLVVKGVHCIQALNTFLVFLVSGLTLNISDLRAALKVLARFVVWCACNFGYYTLPCFCSYPHTSTASRVQHWWCNLLCCVHNVGCWRGVDGCSRGQSGTSIVLDSVHQLAGNCHSTLRLEAHIGKIRTSQCQPNTGSGQSSPNRPLANYHWPTAWPLHRGFG